ncbi:MAG TPA: LUD domain-containing protein [Terracidiphilus sp.]|nr:LUD domain-containing protein [Terracidiphilus sp.]
MNSRDKVLARIDFATGKNSTSPATSYAALKREYLREGRLHSEERVALMIERLRDYDAEVLECSPDDLIPKMKAHLIANRKRELVVPSGLPRAWLVPGFHWRIDHSLTLEQIDRCEGVVTGCFCAVADSGTIVLHHSQMEGRRLLSLLPDWHLCVLRESDIVETFPEYFARCTSAPPLATYISGPSATADIEMTRIKGVHGPRYLSVLLLRDAQH